MNTNQQEMPGKDYCLVVEGIEKWFGGLQAVKGISFNLNQGERLAIIGPNGAGKTTLFNMLSGDLPVSGGKIYLYGEDITTMPNFKRVYLGLARTYQITELFFELSVIDNVILALEGTRKTKFSAWKLLNSNKKLYAEAEELIEKIGLLDKKDELVMNLCYGDQRLIEVLLALASKPKILALDEPTAGLSAGESKTMVELLKKLDKNISFLLIEHDMNIAFDIAERILVMNDGEQIDLGTVEKVRSNQKVQDIYLGVGDDDEDDA